MKKYKFTNYTSLIFYILASMLILMSIYYLYVSIIENRQISIENQDLIIEEREILEKIEKQCFR